MKLRLFKSLVPAVLLMAGSLAECATPQEMVAVLKSNDPKKVEEFYTANAGIIDKKIEFHDIPLIYCMKNRLYKSAKALLACKADPNVTDEFGKAALFFYFDTAALNAKEEDIKDILEAFSAAKYDFKKISGGMNLIQNLIIQENSNLKEEQVANGIKVIDLLVAKGVDPKAKLKDENETPMLTAAFKQLRPMQPAKDAKPAKDPKAAAAQAYYGMGGLEMTKYLVTKHKLGVNDVDKNKATPLISLLANKGIDDALKLDIVKFLMENGAITSAKSKSGETPMKMVEKDSEIYKAMKDAKKGSKKL